MAIVSIEAAQAACAEIARMGVGRISWQRLTETSGSGKARKAGQFDGRVVSKAQVYTDKRGITMVMFFLIPGPTDGPDFNPMRRVRLDTVRVLRAGA